MRCDAELGFDWQERELRPLGEASSRCVNAARSGCNWLVEERGKRCFSCSLSTEELDDGDAGELIALQRAETAKRRLLFELGELSLPIPTRANGAERGLAFELRSSVAHPVSTGHAEGVITLDLAEADDAHRARMREQLGEPYRTLLGHFRHEVGHFYFEVFSAADEHWREQARRYFGDERADYQAALDRHYEQGPPEDWRDEFVSAYATMHPAEDWAETFAHVLHIRDTLQSAACFGVRIVPSAPQSYGGARATCEQRQTRHRGASSGWLADWTALSYGLNEINRSMGHDDLYPFVLSASAVDKLEFVDASVRRGAGHAAPA